MEKFKNIITKDTLVGMVGDGYRHLNFKLVKKGMSIRRLEKHSVFLNNTGTKPSAWVDMYIYLAVAGASSMVSFPRLAVPATA